MVKKKANKAPKENNIKEISKEDAEVIFGIIKTEEKNYASRMLHSVALQRNARTAQQLMGIEIARPHIDEEVYPELLDGLQSREGKSNKYSLDVDKVIHKDDNSTLLGLAVLHENEEAVGVLLRHSASPDHRFSDGSTVLGKALDLYMEFVKHAKTESISRSTPVDIPFGEPKILERSERIVGKLIEHAGLDALEFPLNNDKKTVESSITVTNGLAYGHEDAEGLFTKAIQQIEKNGGSAIDFLNKKNKDGLTTLNVLLGRGNTAGADEVLANLDDPLNRFDLFDAANNRKNSDGITIVVENQQTEDWLNSKYPPIRDAAFAEMERMVELSKEQERLQEERNKEIDEYWERELAKEKESSNKKNEAEDKKQSKSAKRKARLKAKKQQNKEAEKPSSESVSETDIVKELEPEKDSVVVPTDDKPQETEVVVEGNKKWTKVVKQTGIAKRSEKIDSSDKKTDADVEKTSVINSEEADTKEQTKEADSNKKKFTSKLRAEAKSFTPSVENSVQSLKTPDNSYDGYLRDKITGLYIYRDREGRAFESTVDAITSYELGIRDYQNFKQEKPRLSYEEAEQVREIVRSRVNGR